MPKPKRSKKKKLKFKTSLLDLSPKKFASQVLLTHPIQKPEFLETFGGLKLMSLCKSSSPKGKKLKELIFPEIKQSKRWLSENKKLPKFESSSQVFNNEKIIFNMQSFDELNEKKKDKIFMSPGFKDIGKGEGISNVSRVNLECDILPPAVDKVNKLDQIISYIKYKPLIRDPFK